jgi:Kazal-type serine protease inhibitor domain
MCVDSGARRNDIVDVDCADLPCACPLIYAPVCGENGHTYASSCVAACRFDHFNVYRFNTIIFMLIYILCLAENLLALDITFTSDSI